MDNTLVVTILLEYLRLSSMVDNQHALQSWAHIQLCCPGRTPNPQGFRLSRGKVRRESTSQAGRRELTPERRSPQAAGSNWSLSHHPHHPKSVSKQY